MRTADLYVRVSTDEQAEKGYSLRSQKEVLTKYCEQHNIKVREVYVEDHSAKTFDRPQWKNLMIHLRKHKGKNDLLLYTKWDRFSRNATDAYAMIALLKKLGVDPQAIEQPLDLNVPENKMILAIYLTAPEIENDRRGLNTKAGIRQAKKEGRWTGKAPLGYVNKVAENGRRYIAFKEPEASHLKWVFERLAEGSYSAEQVWKSMREKGIVCSKNNFHNAIKNPAYCGKIRLPKFGDEDARLVQGLHEPLITETLFYNVQEVLANRRKVYGTPISTSEDLALRGFLKCPKCPTRMLTGSASKGKKNHVIYYHCTSACGIRYNAKQANEAFVEELMMYVPRNGYDELFVEVVTDCYNNQNRSIKEERKDFMQEIYTLSKRLENARNLMLDNDIEVVEYRAIKEECNEKISRIEAKLNDLNVENSTVIDIRPIAKEAVNSLRLLDEFYEKASVEGKRYLVGILFPEKLTYDGTMYRTPQRNLAMELIYLKNKELQGKKKGQKLNKKSLSHYGWLMGLEPTTLGTTNQYSNQLSYSHRVFDVTKVVFL
jgi:site-specific DNA recombinase